MVLGLSKAKLKYLRALGQKKIRDREKKFLVEGFRLTSEALASDFVVELLLYTEDFLSRNDHAQLIEHARKRKVETLQVTSRAIEAVADTVTAQGVAAVVRQRQFGLSDLLSINRPHSLILALDEVAEPGNVGTAIRTADWFGVSAVLLGKGTVELYNPKVVRSAMGSIFHLPVVPEVDLISVLGNFRERGFVVYGTSAQSPLSYTEVPLAEKAVIVLGNEARGISKEVGALCDYQVAIPSAGRAESLNVGVAGGILLARFASRLVQP